MCLVVVGWRVHPDYPLVVAANRDEFYARPSAPLGYWPDHPQVIAGRDLEAGGTWLGVTKHGRFAAITNVREPESLKGACSRGLLTQTFLTDMEQSAIEFASQIDGALYSGFNLLLCDGESLVYCSNRDGLPRTLEPGIYGLSNHLLDTPWPKLLQARKDFAKAMQNLPNISAFFSLLADTSIVPDEALPHTGVPIEWERLLSAIFVKSEKYGTCASTVLWQRAGRAIEVHEKCFGQNGRAVQSSLISTAV